MRRRCVSCNHLTEKWQRVNGGYWHCYDGCYGTTGYDQRTIDGIPLWEHKKKISAMHISNKQKEEKYKKVLCPYAY